MRTDLCAEALRLGRMMASLTPNDTESLGLLELMELQASRLKARTGPDGEPVLLMDQDRTRWNYLLIRRGVATLERIDQLAAPRVRTPCRPRSPPATREPPPPRTPTGSASPRSTTAWPRSTPSPVVQLNRGVAVAQAFGPQAGPDIVLPPVRRRRAPPIPPAAGGRRRPALRAVPVNVVGREQPINGVLKIGIGAASVAINATPVVQMQNKDMTLPAERSPG
jgi:hypothetical protein